MPPASSKKMRYVFTGLNTPGAPSASSTPVMMAMLTSTSRPVRTSSLRIGMAGRGRRGGGREAGGLAQTLDAGAQDRDDFIKQSGAVFDEVCVEPMFHSHVAAPGLARGAVGLDEKMCVIFTRT